MQTMNHKVDRVEEEIQGYLSHYAHLPCGIAVVKNDTVFTVVKANPAFYEIIGHTPEQLLELHQNHLSKIAMDHFYDAVKHPSTTEDYDFQWDLRIRTADDSIRWVHDCTHYNAKLDVFFLLYIDVTTKMIAASRQLSYEAFLTKNEILAYLGQYTSEHITVTDAITDEVMYMNPSAMNVLGFHQEQDWIGKPYCDIGFGGKDAVPPSYYEPVGEEDFTVQEYYNPFHHMYCHAERKIITIPGLGRKMRLNIITDITAQVELEQKITLQNTLHKCIDTLFTASAMGQDPKDAYCDILGRLERYYHADGAFFYKFKEGTHLVESVYKVSADGKQTPDIQLPITMEDVQIRMMQALSAVNPSHTGYVLDSFPEDYKKALLHQHSLYHINNFACVAINGKDDNILAFMGVTNPQTNQDTKELMELLSRFVYMFIEHHNDQETKQEAVKLEAVSKAAVMETCTKNFQTFTQISQSITGVLDAICRHYDGDFAMILSREHPEDPFGVSYIAGPNVPDLQGLQQDAPYIMKQWAQLCNSHTQLVTDTELLPPAVKAKLQEKYGIYNFIVSPIQNAQGMTTGLLFVNNYKLSNRSHLMVHVVAKTIADYLDKVGMLKKAYLEPLTKLTNKIETQREITTLLNKGIEGALFILDIDHFKGLNDTLGHYVGDQAIVDIASVLKQLFRASDIVGRIGGDEFMVFSPGLTDNDKIGEKANQILRHGHRHYEKNSLTAVITVSIGVCPVISQGETFLSLYEKADQALYTAKRTGKNQYHIYTPTQ